MSNIIDINEDQFIEKVIEQSKTIPVIVDFWAPWCNPCKQLTPILEDLVKKKNKKINLVKVNVDENQNIASELNIQSIPTVYGFVNGRPVEAFQGVQPVSKIENVINKLVDLTPGNEIPKLLIDAEEFFKNKKFLESKEIYEKLVSQDPGNIKIIEGLLRCYLQLKNYDEAKNLIESLEDSFSKRDEIIKIKSLLENLDTDNSKILIDTLKEKLKINPKNTETRFELAELYFRSNENQKAFDELLFIYEHNQQWNDQAAKKKLLEYFELLGLSDPDVVESRKKLSSLMFI